MRHWSVCRDIRTDKRHARDIVNLLALCPSSTPSPVTSDQHCSLYHCSFVLDNRLCIWDLSVSLDVIVQVNFSDCTDCDRMEWRHNRNHCVLGLCPLCAPTFRSTLKSEIFANCFLTHKHLHTYSVFCQLFYIVIKFFSFLRLLFKFKHVEIKIKTYLTQMIFTAPSKRIYIRQNKLSILFRILHRKLVLSVEI